MTSEAVRSGYDAVAAQEKWQQFWEADRTFAPVDDGSKERRYMLDMFPYLRGPAWAMPRPSSWVMWSPATGGCRATT